LGVRHKKRALGHRTGKWQENKNKRVISRESPSPSKQGNPKTGGGATAKSRPGKRSKEKETKRRKKDNNARPRG